MTTHKIERVTYTMTELAAMLGCSKSTVSKYTRNGCIPHQKLGDQPGDPVIYPKPMIDRWLGQQRPAFLRDVSKRQAS